MFSRVALRARGAARLCANVSASTGARAMCSVQNQTVNVTFVDLNGSRTTLPGLVGQSIADVAEMHKLDSLVKGCEARPPYIRRSEEWVEDTYIVGPCCNRCHVLIPKEHFDKIPEAWETEEALLSSLAEAYRPGASRLGCQITLTKEMDGMVAFMPDREPHY
ncbi:unnamed protein product [Chrysoparadoxa australica]